MTFCMIVGITGLPATVYAEGLDDEAIAAADKAALAIGFSVADSVYGVTADLTLPSSGASRSSIAWLSDTPEVIANDGAVTRPDADAEDAEVTLTATITYGEASDTRDFVVTVLKETAPLPGDEADDDEIIPEVGAPYDGESYAEELILMGEAVPAYEEPPDLEMVARTATTVTMTAIDGAEYIARDYQMRPIGEWQDSNVLTGLEPNTSYLVLARWKETSITFSSRAVKTDKAVLGGSVYINGSYVFGQTLTADISLLTIAPTGAEFGEIFYQWTRAGAYISYATGSTYTLTAADIGHMINVKVRAENCHGEINGAAGFFTVEKAPQAKPPVPSAASKTAISITLNATEGAEYRGAGKDWLKETYTHLAGVVLISTAPFTENLTGSVSIGGPAVYGETLTATATGTQGGTSLVYTWYRSGESAPIHTGSTYQTVPADIGRTLRVEAESSGYGGKLISADTAAIAKAVQTPPSLVYTRSGDYEIAGVTVTITSPASGAAYSFDGSTYGTSNSHTFAPGVSSVVIYARLDETSTHLQSDSASLALDFTKQNQTAPTVALSVTADENLITLHISAGGGQSGSYAYKIAGGSYADLPEGGDVTLTIPGETIMVSVCAKGDAYYNPSPDISQAIALPKYLNSATVTVSEANFTKTAHSIAMSAAPVASNGGEMEYSFDGAAYVTLDINALPSFTGLAAGSNHTIALQVQGSTEREAGEPTSVTLQTLPAGGTGSSDSGRSIITIPEPNPNHPPLPDAEFTPTEQYIDIAGHWAIESINYVLARGLFSGTSATTFSPDTAMERGMLVTVLGRLAGATVRDYQSSSFSDVAADTYYLPYIEWAYDNDIISGIGNNQFAPQKAVTREQIALILQNYAQSNGYILPVTRESITFADDAHIGSSYKAAVRAMQEAGIMVGGSGNKFNPQYPVTRAEAAAILHRYVKLIIDPATVQG
jgi:hypothetical protein